MSPLTQGLNYRSACDIIISMATARDETDTRSRAGVVKYRPAVKL